MPLPRLVARLIPADRLWRKLIVIRLADSIGRGIFLSGSVVYFTLHVGLPAREVGLGLSAAAVSALTSVVVIGALADRVGKRRLLSVLFAAIAVGFALYTLVRNAAEFFPLIFAAAFAEAGTSPVEDALMVTIVPSDQLVKLKAMNRTVFNIGFSVGIGISAVAAASQPLLIAIPISAAAVMAITAGLITRLPEGPPSEIPSGIRRFSAVRDVPYLKVIAISAILALHASIVTVVLPLWALHRTAVPHFVVPLLLIVNTAFVILFQMRASNGVDDVKSAGRTARRSGYWLAAGCVVAAITAVKAVGASPATAACILIAAILFFSVAEVLQSASGWALAFGLAPQHAQGEYLGAFELHVISQGIVGPAVLSAVVIAYGSWGWAATAIVVLAASVLIAPAALRSEAIMKARQAGTPAAAGSAEVLPAGP
jgi:hypothetical protein